LNKLDLIIPEKQAELRALQADLTDALTGIDSPDFRRAAMIQPLVNDVQAEIVRLQKLREVAEPPQDFSAYLSRLLTDDDVTKMELWVTIKNHGNEVTVRLLEIRKWKTGYQVTCALRFPAPLQNYLYALHTNKELEHIGWTAGRGGKTFRLKAQVKNLDQFDAFTQKMAVTMLEALGSLWRRGQQIFRYR